jgi:1,2-diacylglycerol 3-beta-galactosyltransferase
MMPKRILFLMSDTGGGHRAAAEAIRDAILEKYGAEAITAELIDVYKKMHFPADKMPELYPWLVNKALPLWTAAYRIGDSPRRSRFLSKIAYRGNKGVLRQMALEHPADAVCCVHSVVHQPSMSAYYTLPVRPPWVTVVTDLVTAPYFWYDRRVDRCLVPTPKTYERGIECGLTPEQLRVTGLPVHPNFTRRLTDKRSARAALGWPSDKTCIMMVAGGEGMGPMQETVEALIERNLDAHFVVVCGKNAALKERIDVQMRDRGVTNVTTYGFVTDMPKFMAAADVLVTKAGPATISEACIAGLPIILSGAIPGQEDGNVTFVVQNDAGAFAPGPQKVAAIVAQWLAEGPDALAERGERARRIARPDAVWEIADEVWNAAHQPPVATTPRAQA